MRRRVERFDCSSLVGHSQQSYLVCWSSYTEVGLRRRTDMISVVQVFILFFVDIYRNIKRGSEPMAFGSVRSGLGRARYI
jgi:hypothetical protein